MSSMAFNSLLGPALKQEEDIPCTPMTSLKANQIQCVLITMTEQYCGGPGAQGPSKEVISHIVYVKGKVICLAKYTLSW